MLMFKWPGCCELLRHSCTCIPSIPCVCLMLAGASLDPTRTHRGEQTGCSPRRKEQIPWIRDQLQYLFITYSQPRRYLCLCPHFLDTVLQKTQIHGTPSDSRWDCSNRFTSLLFQNSKTSQIRTCKHVCISTSLLSEVFWNIWLHMDLELWTLSSLSQASSFRIKDACDDSDVQPEHSHRCCPSALHDWLNKHISECVLGVTSCFMN